MWDLIGENTTHIIQIVKDVLVFMTGRHYHKSVSFPPLACKFNVIPIKIPAGEREFILSKGTKTYSVALVVKPWYLPQT